MARKHINGVRNINSNGITFSFILEDTYETKNDGIMSSDVAHIITELDAAENIFSYLLDEIKKIKKITTDNSPTPSQGLKRTQEVEGATIGNELVRPPLGKKLSVLKSDHDT